MQETNAKTKKISWIKQHYLQILALLFSLGLSAVLILNRAMVAELGVYGYFGIFVISMISSSSILVPVPGWILVAAMGAILNPVLVGIISGLGGTIGELTGYLLGYGGQIAVKDSRLYARMIQWMKRWGGATIFGLALIPNPFFDVAGAAAGLLRYPVWKFIVYGAAGRIPKHIFFAYTGAWGMHFLAL